MVDTVHSDAHPLMDAAEIEKELVQLWRQMGAEEKPVVRARVLTLVVAAREEEENRIVEWLMQLAERHPARNIILLLGDEADEESLDAGATLLCSTRGRTVCAEQIRIHASGPARARVPSAVRMLVSADLPVALWWNLSSRLDDPLLRELEPMVDQLFFDSADVEELSSLSRALPGWQREHITDLNWGRLDSWRELIALFFDPPPRQALLQQIELVTLRHGPHPVGAMLLAGWLASRLDWELREASDERWLFARPDGGEVTVEFQEVREAPGLQLVEIRAGEARFRVRRAGDHVRCESEVQDEHSLPQVVPLQDAEIPALLSQQLDQFMTSSIYLDALAVVQEALEAAHD